jgi:hypothetical protein
VLASKVVAVLFPVKVKKAKVEFALNVELPVRVRFELAFNDVDVTFVVEALTFRKLPPRVVLPLAGIMLAELATIEKLDVVELATKVTIFVPL